MTHVHPPTNTVSPETLERRCKETFEAAMKIHGGTISNKRPALDGLYHTISKKCKTSVLGDYVLSNSKVTVSSSNVKKISWQNLNVQKIMYRLA